MSYVALYRKWRPDTFSEVKGQDAVTTTLKNQLTHQRIGHAYLFCGTRGTGKTSVAKLLAKAVNCENPREDGSPCCECANCQAIRDGSSMDVIEIDAASNNGVDNIRTIRDEVQYSPTNAKYKVYIIDEVHMLSTGAFNALLKTLEEPPAYVIFILATTEAHKIPITILSRCQRYDFHRISPETISARLGELMERENQKVEQKALDYIAKMADGSMRDALSLLDQCISFYLGETLTYEKCLEILGAVDTDVFVSLLQKINAKEIDALIDLVDQIIWQGKDLTQFVADFTWFLRNVLVLKTSKDGRKHLDYSEEHFALMEQVAEECSTAGLVRFIRIFSELTGSMRRAGEKRVLLEVTMLKLCAPEMERNDDAILQRMDELQKQIKELQERPAAVVTTVASTGKAKAQAQAQAPELTPEQKLEKLRKELPEATFEELREIAGKKQAAFAKLDPALRVLLDRSDIYADQRTMGLVVMLDDKNRGMLMSDPKIPEQIELAFEEEMGKKVHVTMLERTGQAKIQDGYVQLRDFFGGLPVEVEDD